MDEGGNNGGVSGQERSRFDEHSRHAYLGETKREFSSRKVFALAGFVFSSAINSIFGYARRSERSALDARLRKFNLVRFSRGKSPFNAMQLLSA